ALRLPVLLATLAGLPHATLLHAGLLLAHLAPLPLLALLPVRTLLAVLPLEALLALGTLLATRLLAVLLARRLLAGGLSVLPRLALLTQAVTERVALEVEDLVKLASDVLHDPSEVVLVQALATHLA